MLSVSLNKVFLSQSCQFCGFKKKKKISILNIIIHFKFKLWHAIKKLSKSVVLFKDIQRYLKSVVIFKDIQRYLKIYTFANEKKPWSMLGIHRTLVWY